MKFKIAGIGELLWDIFPSGKKMGGAPFNFAFHTFQAGCESYIISAVGNDPLGSELLDNITHLGVDIHYVQKNDYPTGTVIVHINHLGQPDFRITENVAWDHIRFVGDLQRLAPVMDAVCFGSLAQRDRDSEETIHAFISHLRSGCLKVFDINLRQNYYTPDILNRSLNLADILKLNDNELPVVADLFHLSGDINFQLKQLIQRFNITCIAYTRGSEGSILMTADEISEMKAPHMNVVDTVGAGDAFTAALVNEWLNGMSLSDVHNAASNVAAFVCTKEGATPDIPKYLFG